MALRSMGSTLLAKTAPGTQLRRTEEQRAEGAVPNESAQAQPTSTSRELENKPFETSTPEGTLKNVATKPSMQDKVSIERSQSPLLAGAMGMPSMSPTAIKAGSPTPGGSARPISAGGVAAPRSEMAAAPISGGASILSQINKADPMGALSGAERTAYAKQGSQITAPAAMSKVEAPNTSKAYSAGVNPLVGWLGSRVSADEPAKAGDQTFTRSLLQSIAATIGDRLMPKESAASQNLMSFADNPARSGDTGIIRNLNQAASGNTPSAANNPTIQAMASNVKAAAQPVVNKVSQATAPLRSAATQAASNFSKPNVQAMTSNVGAAAKQAVSTVSNWLRSLFR